MILIMIGEKDKILFLSWCNQVHHVLLSCFKSQRASGSSAAKETLGVYE